MVHVARTSIAPVLQALLAISALLLVLAPPVQGAMLVVPLGTARPLPALLDAGARPLAAGPVSGSIVVEGERSALWRAALASGAVLVAARGGCAGVKVER